jgi:hypothetical protein
LEQSQSSEKHAALADSLVDAQKEKEELQTRCKKWEGRHWLVGCSVGFIYVIRFVFILFSIFQFYSSFSYLKFIFWLFFLWNPFF